MKANKQTDPSLLSTQEGITACTLTIHTLKSALMKQTAKTDSKTLILHSHSLESVGRMMRHEIFLAADSMACR